MPISASILTVILLLLSICIPVFTKSIVPLLEVQNISNMAVKLWESLLIGTFVNIVEINV